MKSDNGNSAKLYLQAGAGGHITGKNIVVVGEVLWDLFPDSVRLGGAALNFAAHAKRLGQEPLLISAVGADELGDQARQAIHALGLDCSLIQTTRRFKTGTACVQLGRSGNPSFMIERPAAYDAVELSHADLQHIAKWQPEWVYFGTLFPSSVAAHDVLQQVLEGTPHSRRFYDLNLRPGGDSPDLVRGLLRRANVVKLNEGELNSVHEFTRLPADTQGFCRAGVEQYGWSAVCITLGARGCAISAGGEYVEAQGLPVNVADTVGAGDAFAAAFLHGIISNWPALQIAEFSNRIGALVASVHGAIPNWTLKEVVD